MDLGTFANWLQVITSIGCFFGFYKWGKQQMKKYPKGYIVALFVIGASAVVTALSLAQSQGWLPTTKPEQVFNKHYKGEVVVLDNKEFYNTTFEDVEFQYAGGYYRLENVQLIPPIKITTTNMIVTRGIYLLNSLGLLDKTKSSGFVPAPLPK